MYRKQDDTIAAIATAPLDAAISIVRISGKNAFLIIEKIFSKKSLIDSPSHSVHYGKIVDSKNRVIDTVLLILLKSPNSFTGEDTIEICCHGGQLITKKVLERVLEAGARAAHPGEFTYRAFLNKKMDLTQAEAIQELIGAKNENAIYFANSHLQGSLSNEIKKIQKNLTELAAHLEAYLDFPEEDLPPSIIKQFFQKTDLVTSKMQKLLSTYEDGKRLFTGISLCIVGAPNVGKSSLMNALLKEDRAIVTSIAGTTRDLLQETCHWNSFHFQISDTAGIHETNDIIEKEGIERTKKAMKISDLILLVLDASRSLTKEDKDLIKSSPIDKTLILWNKIDLSSPKEKFSYPTISISAKQNLGLENLKNKIFEKVFRKNTLSKDEIIISKLRHKKALENAINYCSKVKSGIKENRFLELIAQDLRLSLYEIQTIIGTDVTEDILSSIFSKFCIGK